MEVIVAGVFGLLTMGGVAGGMLFLVRATMERRGRSAHAVEMDALREEVQFLRAEVGRLRIDAGLGARGDQQERRLLEGSEERSKEGT